MICFSQPRYPGEIIKLLTEYGRTTQQSQLLLNNKKSRITILLNNEWIKKLTKKEKQLIIEKIEDGRAKKRQYFQSTLTPLINYFDQQIPLAKNEKRQLEHLFKKESFKQMFSWENQFYSFNNVKEFLAQLTLWIHITNKYTEPYQIKTKSNDERKEKFSIILDQLFKKRNEIAERISPKLKINITPSQKDQYYSFMNESSEKLKPPLLNKLMKLTNNSIIFEMAISMLASGEFINEFHTKNKSNKKSYKK
jgi:hypothetical protein